MFKNLYYGLWSSMSGWAVWKRAAIVIAFLAVIIYIFSPLIIKVFALFLRGVKLVVGGIYLALNFLLELILQRADLEKKANIYNKHTNFFRMLTDKIDNKVKNLHFEKRISFWKIIVVYGILMIIIGVPFYLNGIVDPAYLKLLSKAADTYQNMEKNALEKAKNYPPLFMDESEPEEKPIEEPEPKQGEGEKEEEKEAEETKRVWLSLSKKGRSGANVRKKPSKKADVITAISGKDKVLYLNRQKNGWVYVKLKSGEKGWIKKTLLKNVPEE